ncbi:hypothetical protein [Tolumonas osonensis]|uniref:Uncharacterized protein n=1 Tax=Tolumonas osonensis TaxID=675874 RepID=A0A841GLY5_9GAMM|nr:hypothetical protein [Tolumonas osonensis]MBB6055492.1 hypothetical protein [Tolumonas osonensis]
MKRINLITSCTNSKKRGSNAPLRLSHIKDHVTNLDRLAKKWLTNVHDELSNSGGYSVTSMYRGSHWFNAIKASNQSNIDLWVISAGLGLLHCDDKIINYQATFSSGYDDSIPKYEFTSVVSNQKWWSCLCDMTTNITHPNSISSLMETRRDELFIIAASNQYIEAVFLDLINGMKHLNSPESQLVVITSGKLKVNELDKCLLFSESKLKKWLGCNMVSLNICLANRLIEFCRNSTTNDFILSKKIISNEINNVAVKEERKTIKCTDDEILEYIAMIKKFVPDISASNCLKNFRQMGNSSEERRFRNLFNK